MLKTISFISEKKFNHSFEAAEGLERSDIWNQSRNRIVLLGKCCQTIDADHTSTAETDVVLKTDASSWHLSFIGLIT